MVNIKHYLKKSSPQSASTATNSSPSASTENLNSSVVEMDNSESENPSIEEFPTNPSAQKRNRSQNSDSEDSKRQNLNDTLSSTNSNNNTENVCSDSLDLDRSIFDQLEVSFEGKTPHWVPLLIKSFDALNRELSSNMRSLSEEVKSINGKFDTFSADISKRIESLEKDSDALKKNQGEIANDISALQTQVTVMKKKGEEHEKGIDFVSSQYEGIKNESSASEQKLNEIEKGVQFLNEACEDLKKEVTKLTNHNSVLKKSFDTLSSQVNSNEQHNRNECLLLHGVQESEKETPGQSRSIFMKEINQHLGFQFDGNEIRRAHRLGQKRSNGKPRPIIARFWSSEVRNNIFFQKKGCKNKGISITENLTKRNMQLKLEAEKKYGSGNVWTREGRIFAKNNNTIIPVPT